MNNTKPNQFPLNVWDSGALTFVMSDWAWKAREFELLVKSPFNFAPIYPLRLPILLIEDIQPMLGNPIGPETDKPTTQ
jgi:hypothetical protein